MKKHLYLIAFILLTSIGAFASPHSYTKKKETQSLAHKKTRFKITTPSMVFIVRTSCMTINFGEVSFTSLTAYLDTYAGLYLYFQNICDLYSDGTYNPVDIIP